MCLENYSLRVRLTEGSKGGMLVLLVISVVWVLGVSRLSAADSADHPYVETKDLKPETCLKCHPAKNQGKFVHTAVGMGCMNCHLPASAYDKTIIALIATGGDLCARCHEAKKDPVQHGPFQAGQCLVCHDPHTGDYKAQTRAAVNTLCLSCHMLNQPDARVNAQTKIVSLLDGRIYDLASWESAPKISAGHPENRMPDKASDRVMVKKSENLDAEPNCLSCHDPHASKAKYLLHQAAEGRGVAKNLSLQYHADFMRANGGPKNVPVLQGPFPGGWL